MRAEVERDSRKQAEEFLRGLGQSFIALREVLSYEVRNIALV
jgi:hypothetical protein